MRIRPNVALSLAAALTWGALLSPPARAAGTKSDAADTISDDLTGATAGTVEASGGGRTLDGGLSQIAINIDQLASGTTVEAGFFSAIATTPSSGLILTVSSSAISASWTDAATPNPSGTLYTLQASTVPNFSGALLATSVYAFTGSISGLNANATYYLRVQATYTDDDENVYLALGSTTTLSSGGGYPGCAATNRVGAGQTYATISAAVNALPASLPAGESCVVIEDGATYLEQVSVRNFTMNASSIGIFADPGTGLTPVVNPPAASTAAFVIANASVSVMGINIVSTNTITYGVFISSAYVQLSSVNVQDAGGKIATAGIVASSWTTVSYSSVTVGGTNAAGIWLPGSMMTSVSYSSAAANSSTLALTGALWLNGASSNTITQSYINNPSGYGAYLDANSNSNTISRSTMTTNNSSSRALYLFGANSNTITQCSIANPVGAGAYVTNSNYNTISQSSMISNASAYALYLYASSSNTITQSYIADPASIGAYLDLNSSYNTINQSSITSNNAIQPALRLNAALSNTFSGDYIQGSTAVYVLGSTGTVIGGSVLVATNTAGSALQLGGGSVGLTLSGSVLTAGSAGTAVYVGGDSGLIVLSTNTMSGAEYGVFVASPALGTQIWVTSNTIVPAVTNANNTYGLYFNGLASGATIENNAVAYRTPGSMGSFTSYALYALSAAGLQIDHNRFDDPGMVTGSFVAAAFVGTKNTAFKFNDVNSTGTAIFTNAYLLEATSGSTGLTVKDNVFLSSFAVTGASATMLVDATSEAGFAADYNDYSSLNASLGFRWGTSGASGLPAWSVVSSQDAHSISANPLWANPAPGTEDFHPLSISGRWNQATQSLSFVDATQSPTIDAGDPAEAYTLEPAPNGGVANQGSYGDTAQASESAATPTSVALVSVGSSSATVSFGSVGANDYVVQASTTANFSGVLYSSDTTTGATVLSPQGLSSNTTYYLRAGALAGTTTAYASAVLSTSTLASLVSGTTVYQIDVTSMVVSWIPPSSASGYILQASSRSDFSTLWATSSTPNVALSTLTASGLTGGVTYYFRVGSLNWDGAVDYAPSVSAFLPVQLSAGYAGCALTNRVGAGQTYATISAAVSALPASLPAGESCVVIEDAATYSEQVTVQNFTMSASSIAIFADPGNGLTPAVDPPAGTAAFVIANASVSVSGIDIVPTYTITYGVYVSSAYVQLSDVNVQDAAGKIVTAGIVASSWTTVSDSSVTVGGANASAFSLPGSAHTTVSDSSAAAKSASGYALWLNAASSNSFTAFLASNPQGYGAYLVNGSNNNTISLSTMASDASGDFALYLNDASANTIIQSYITNPAGYGADLEQYSNGNTISRSTMTSASPAGYALYMNNVSSNTITQSYMTSPAGYGADLSNSNYNTISQSTITSGVSAYNALYLNGSAFNTITQSYIANPAGTAVALDPANATTINQSTMTSSAAGYYGLSIADSVSSTISGDSIQGSTAVYVQSSTTTAISGSILAATTAAGSALQMDGGSQNLTLTGSTLTGGSAGAAVYLGAGAGGAIVLSTDTLSGARNGLFAAAPAAGAALSLAGIDFTALNPGATAINFGGGVYVSTFVNIAFNDPNMAVNVAAAGLSAGSSITMQGSSGVKAGPGYDDDPNLYVHWPGFTAPTSAIAAPAAPFVNSLASVSGTAQAYSGASVLKVYVAVQNLSTGLYWNGSSFASSTLFANSSLVTGASSATWTYITGALSASLTNGTSYQIHSQAVDSESQVQIATSAVTFVFDNLPPTSAIISPANGAFITSGVSLSGTAFDNVQLSTVQLSLQDVTTGGCYYPSNNAFASACPSWFGAQGSSTAWSYAFAVQPWTQAHQYVLLSSGTDVAGNMQAAQSASSFAFDVLAPTATVTVPATGYLNPTQTAFVGTSTDALTGLASVQLALSSGAGLGAWMNASNLFVSAIPIFFATTTYAVGNPDNWTWTYPAALVDGQKYQLRVQSTNRAGIVGVQNTSFTYDATPPVATIASPTNGSVLSSVPTIAGGASDAPGPAGFASGVSTVALSLQDSGTGLCYSAAQAFTAACPSFFPASGSTAAWAFTPATASLMTGHRYWVTAQGVDNAGNVQNVFAVGVSSVLFTYDTAVPQVGITAPIPQAGDRETPATLGVLSGTAFDPGGNDLALVQIRVRNNAGPMYWDPATGNFDLAATNSEQAWFAAITTTQYQSWTSTTNNISYAGLDGSTFTVTARAMNLAGTYSTTYASNTFVYDSLAPQTGVTSPANGASMNALTVLAGTAADLPASDPGLVVSVQLRLKRLSDGFYWNGSAWYPVLSTLAAAVDASSWSVTGANLPSGPNLLSGASYYATTSGTDNADGGGNTETWNSPRGSTFTYDTTPPSVFIQLPVAGAVYASLPTVSGTSADNVAVATVTLSVQQLGGGVCYSPASGNFSAACPASFPTQGTASAWTYNALPWINGQQYSIIATAKDFAGNVSSSSTTFTFAISTGLISGTPGDGQGAAALTPSSAAGCQLLTATATFTAGPAGLAPGGAIALHIPSGWTQPQGVSAGQPGYVQVLSASGYNAQFNPASLGNATLGANWVVYLATTNVTPGQTVQFIYQGYPAQGSSAQGPQIFAFESRGAGNGNLAGLSSSPALSVTPGTAALLSFSPSSPLTLGQFQNSPPMQLQIWDTCGVPTTQTGSPLSVALQANVGGATDAQAVFYSTAGSPVSSVAVPVGGGLSPGFYFNTSTSGVSLENLLATAVLGGSAVSVVRPVDLLPAPASINGVSVDTGALGSALSATIVENSATGAGASAFINFSLSNPALSWEVIVSSNPATFTPKLADYFGAGNPGRTLTWNGLNNQTAPPQFLPPGPYYVEIIAGGGSAVNTALTVAITPSPSIYGQVTDGAGANVTAIGPNVQSGNFAVASSTGFFQIFGLQSGTAYLIQASSSVLIANAPLTVTASTSGVVATAAGTNAGSLTLPLPSLLEVSATLPFPAPADISGTVSVHDSSFTHTGSGTVHFFPGATSSDNGAQAFGANASTWTAIAMPPGTYEVDVILPALGISTSIFGIVVTNASSAFLPIALQKLVNVYGYAILPAPVAANTWVTVSAQNQAGASAVGGVGVPVAASSAVYSLFGLSPGSWTVTAAVSQGALPASTTVVVAGTADIGTAAAGGLNLTLKAGGVLSGTLNVVGNTSSANMTATCPGGAALCAVVTGYGPTNFFNGAVTVVLATSTTQTSSTFSFVGLPDGLYSVSAALNGFNGPGQNVSVVSGTGTANIALTANGSKMFVTVNLPAGVHPASDFKSVALGCAGSLGTALAFPDMTAGTTIQYFASSATMQLSGLNADIYQFQAFYAATGMYRTVSAPLAGNATASLMLDLSAATYAVGGSFSLGANLNLPNSAGLSVAISSVPGLLANIGSLNYCLLGYLPPLTLSAAHLELLPAGSAGTFASGPLQTTAAACSSNLISPATAAGPTLPNPYLAYVATIGVNGSFAFSGVPAGVYLLRNNSQLDAAGDQIPQFSQTVIVTSTVAGLIFQAGSGATLSGSVLAPLGAPLSRSLNVSLLNGQGQLTASAQAVFNNSNSASYSFAQIVNGNYTLVVQDSAYPKAYAAAPLQVQMSGQNQTGQNVSLVPSGTIACRVVIQEPAAGGGLQSLLISPSNVGLLPSSFQIQASADPWFSGGLASAGGPSGAVAPTLNANGEFLIDGLLPGTYDVKFAAQGGGAGTVSLVNSSVPGIAVTAGNVTDIGAVNLGGGTQLAGVVSDGNSAPLANIHVHASPSQRGSGVATQAVDAVTDGSGRYVLAGLDPTVRFYDVYAAFRGVEVQGENLPPYQQTISPSIDLSSLTVLNFALAAAPYSVSGHVVVPAGGPALGVPAAGGQTAQGALIYFQKSGVIPTSNPIADIQFQTDFNGNFTIPSLATGTYLMTAASLGYSSLSQLVTIATASVNVGALTMTQGATLTGSLTNPDGSSPSVGQVAQIIAVTSDLSNILIGSLTSNPNTRTATAYSIAGFKPGLSYRVLLLDSQNGMIAPPEASAVVFASTQSETVNIVYRPVAPLVIALAARSGSGFQLEFEMSQPLRSLTQSDNDLPAILTPISAAGTLSTLALSQDRTSLTAFYVPGVSESSFTFHLRGYSTLVNPASVDPVNPQFLSESTVTFYAGIDGLGQTNVANLQGGDVLVQGDNGRVTLAPGSFNVAVSSSVLITLQVAEEPLSSGVTAAGLGAAARLQSLRYGPQSYPSEVVAAAAAVPPNVNPLSAFYNIFLPLGVNTALSKPAQLTVAYSTGSDPATLNLYWYNPAANAYILTQDVTGAAPVINTANHTITLNVSHFSTYVLFQSAQAVITGGTGAGALQVDNFPNPFDLSATRVTPLHATGSSCSPNCTINGTMIGVSVPPNLSGDAIIRIFNVAGTRVRTIDLGTVQGGTFYYQNWNGTNDAGMNVASGAYIGELKIGGQTVFFKMALIKGSGL